MHSQTIYTISVVLIDSFWNKKKKSPLEELQISQKKSLYSHDLLSSVLNQAAEKAKEWGSWLKKMTRYSLLLRKNVTGSKKSPFVFFFLVESVWQ